MIADLDPGRIFGDDARELLRDMVEKGWETRRLSGLLAREPESVTDSADTHGERHLFVPTTGGGRAATDLSETNAGGRALAILLDDDRTGLGGGVAQLEQGVASRRRAIENGSSGHFLKALLVGCQLTDEVGRRAPRASAGSRRPAPGVGRRAARLVPGRPSAPDERASGLRRRTLMRW